MKSAILSRAIAVCFAILPACAEATPPPESADTPPESGVVDAPTGEQGNTGTADVASDTAAPTSSGEISAADLSAALQLVLEDEAIQPYLKLEEPGRFPLKVGGDLPPGLTLTKNTKPVVFVTAGSSDKAAIVFTSIESSSDKVSVRFHFEDAGTRGAATVEKHEGRWEIKNSRVTEH
jgi:hypothetical protein